MIEGVLQAAGLAYAYRGASRSVFDGLNASAEAGSMLAILGNNGAGKSTLLDLLAGIARPAKGKVSVSGEDLAAMRRRAVAKRIAYVTQQQAIPHLRVYDEVLLGRKPHIGWSLADKDRSVVADCLVALGLEGFADRFCDELSGGERQKVLIARALAQEPRVLILDEPTSALDPRNQLEVMAAIRSITLRENLATVLVLHDINLALRFCDRFMLVRDGRVVARGGRDVVTDEAVSETYGTRFRIVEVEGARIAVPCIA